MKTKVSKNVEDANTIMRCKRACVHVVCPCLNWLAGGGGGRGIAYFKLVDILVTSYNNFSGHCGVFCGLK